MSLVFTANEETNKIESITLYGEELLNSSEDGQNDLVVNGRTLKTRPHGEGKGLLKGEHFIDHFSGWGLVMNRGIGPRHGMQFECTGVNYLIRRELADMTDLPCPGPGGPVNEAPLYVDSFGLMNWDWKFWGDKTRMIFPSSHTQGPSDEFGHIGYENDTPANAKKYMQNVWRRTYPSTMVVHGGLYYNEETEHWIAITCRRAHVGYQLNIDNSGDGVGYDFLLHAPFEIGDSLRMPEVKIYHGKTNEKMQEWLAWYVTFYYEECPDWVFQKSWGGDVCWNNQPTWKLQADYWDKQIDDGQYSAIGYSLVTNRAIQSGTTPTGYEPDPNFGTQAEFKKMCHRMRDRDVPILIWMSHSGISPGAEDIDDDWFIRGIDGRGTAGWGSVDGGMVMCNPGHPGYIEYTKKWIHFYIVECGCKGIFFDCLGWVFPPDFSDCDFQRFPADSNRLTVKFQTEIYEFIKECDPEAILLGEGASLEAPINIFSIAGNPIRAVDGMGPRDFFLNLNKIAPKRMVVDQGGVNLPVGGMCKTASGSLSDEYRQFMTKLLAEKGGPDAFSHLVGDLSIMDDMLFFPVTEGVPPNTEFFPPRDIICLPEPWDKITTLTSKFHEHVIEKDADGNFNGLEPGVYVMS
ncbi:MAG: hypothetical protein HRT89_23315 [Lentisphaeria bacterium]|nr:hypothetical protein [Lentisphaeria bacterium]NQZ70991.1 hypothetical protein [Lentisphaeria bacterium]